MKQSPIPGGPRSPSDAPRDQRTSASISSGSARSRIDNWTMTRPPIGRDRTAATNIPPIETFFVTPMKLPSMFER